ncbi:MAG: sulfatase, partial [Tabrizicola sp.]
GQSLLPLVDPSFGTFDETKSPITSVFGTLSVRPSIEGYRQFRYFRYPNGEEHVYDVVADPGETENLIATAPMDVLRGELVKGALELGLDLRGFENPADGVNAMMAVDGSVVLEGRRGNDNYWVYGAEAEKIRETKDGGNDTLWYLGGPDNYVLHCPMNVENIRIATVLARNENATAADRAGRVLRIVAHPDSPITFETTERVMVDVRGSRGNDVMIGPKYGGATFYGGEGDDLLKAITLHDGTRHFFYGGAGNDRLIGGGGRDLLDGGTGDDTIMGTGGRNRIFGGHGNDHIFDGDGSSVLHTGPGRNRVHLGGDNDTVHAGTGVNLIDPGPGAVVFVLAYGGVTHVSQWQVEQVYELTAWPKAPTITRRSDGTVDVTLGLSVLRIAGVPEGHDVTTQITQGAE